MSKGALVIIGLLAGSFALGYGVSWQTQSLPSATFVEMSGNESPGNAVSFREGVPLSSLLGRDSDTAKWLAYQDVLSSPAVPWKAVLREARLDTEMQKLVCLHWARREARACWDHLVSIHSQVSFEILAAIVLENVPPQLGIHWPDDTNDPSGNLRWAVFHRALADDMAAAFSLASAIEGFGGSDPSPDWARKNPQRALELVMAQSSLFQRKLLPSVAQALVEQDLSAALSWMREQKSRDIRQAACRGLAEWLADEKNTSRLEAVLGVSKNLSEREALLGPILMKWRNTDPERAAALAETHLQGSSLWRRMMRRP